jgi:hypothetical protein
VEKETEPREKPLFGRITNPTETSISIFFLLLSVCSDRILRLSESKENVFSLPNVSKMPKGNVTKERRRRCIFAKFLLIPLNSRGWLPTHKPTPPSREFLTLHSKKFLTLICKVATLSLREEYFFFVTLNENIGQHDSPTEPRGVKKINGENVKKALVPWYAMGCLTIAWHFNAFSERH